MGGPGIYARLGLFRRFCDVIICREDVQRIKPDTRVVPESPWIRSVKAKRGRGLLNDSQVGVLAARHAGIRVVAVPNQTTAHGTIEGASPGFLVSFLAELPLGGSI